MKLGQPCFHPGIYRSGFIARVEGKCIDWNEQVNLAVENVGLYRCLLQQRTRRALQRFWKFGWEGGTCFSRYRGKGAGLNAQYSHSILV